MKLRFRLAYRAKEDGEIRQRAFDDHFDFPDIGLEKPIYNSEETGLLIPIAADENSVTFELRYKGHKSMETLVRGKPCNMGAAEGAESVFYQITFE